MLLNGEGFTGIILNGESITKAMFNGSEITNALLNSQDQTIVNLLNNGVNFENWATYAGLTRDSDGLHIHGTGSSVYCTLNSTGLQTNTEYTLVFLIESNTANVPIKTSDVAMAFASNVTVASTGQTGVVKIKLTTLSTIANNRFGLKLNSITGDISFKIMLFEGDQMLNDAVNVYMP
jgi:hypothetical protein